MIYLFQDEAELIACYFATGFLETFMYSAKGLLYAGSALLVIIDQSLGDTLIQKEQGGQMKTGIVRTIVDVELCKG